MTGYAVRRLLQIIPTVLLSTLLLFLTLNLMRGDAIDVYFGMSEDRSPEAVAALEERLGLDKPLAFQYLTWLGGVVRGDFGESWRLQDPVLPLIFERMLLSLELALIASLISIAFSLLLGTYLATRQNSAADQVIRVVSLFFISAPIYWVALGLILVLWGLLSIPSFSRYVRNAVLDVLSADYVRTARAKGLAERQMLRIHVLRNAAGPLATVVGLSIGAAAGGTLLLEVVFSLPGMGRLWLTAIAQRDYPLVLGIGVVISIIFVLVNLLTDLSYAVFDPRIRYR
jgi:peptide/nickel transport system permease protein